MDARQKMIFSTFAGIATRYRDVPAGKQAEIVGASDTYVGDFGETDAILDRFMPARSSTSAIPEYVSLAYLRPMTTEVMAKTADGQKRMIICEWGLRVKCQYSWAAIADLT